ncbi:MAG: DMT family transporter [Clostridia bacterium]|nr:DMT family transporter [Clostridia bacterium]
MNKREMTGNILLTVTAIIWGISFVAQSVGMQYVGPFTYQSIRSLTGFIVMIPVVMIFGKKGDLQTPEQKKLLLEGGLVCGIIFTVASNLQQYGIQYTTVGKAGFLTALYMIIVPMISIFLKKKPTLNLWISIVIAVAGMYLLCINGEFRLATGDIYIILCALAFSFHILAIDRYANRVDPLKLSLLQYLICGIVSMVPMILFEKVEIGNILSCWAPLLYGGVLSTGVGYTLQMVGQKFTNPTVASILMCLESVFSLIAGIIILGQVPSTREIIGCVLMFIAIIITQIPAGSRDKEQTEKGTA